MKYVLVSECLLGVNCRYDGKNSRCDALLETLKDCAIIPICPEQLGGLTTPRPPAQINGGSGIDVLMKKAQVLRVEDKVDVTEQYVKGAEAALYLAKLFKAEEAYMKEKSPACGVHFIKRGKEKVDGSGVCTALLQSEGLKIHSVE